MDLEDDELQAAEEMLYAIDTRRCPKCHTYLEQSYSMEAHDWVFCCPGCKWEMFGNYPDF